MSMLYLILTPGYGNVLSRGVVAAAPDPAANSVFPVSHAYDGQAQEAFAFSSLTGDAVIVKDSNLITNPTFSSSAANWTPQDGNTVNQLINAIPGERLAIKATTSATATVKVINTITGYYLTSSGTWQSGSTNAISVNGAAQVTFQVESLITCRDVSPVPLWVEVNDYTKFTSCVVFPAANFASVHFHNLDKVTGVLFEYSDDGVVYQTITTLSIRRPAFYGVASALHYHRYWRLKFSGTNDSIIYLGEAVIGHALTMDPAPRWDWKEEDTWPATVHRNDLGNTFVNLMTQYPHRGLKLDFTPYTTTSTESVTALDFIRRSIWQRSGAGAYPGVFVVRDSRTDTAVLGRLSQSIEAAHMLPNAQNLGLVVEPLPFGILGAINATP